MDNSGKEAEAMALLAEAERKVKNSQSFFSGLFGGSSKIEEACEIYTRAANMFKMAKNWSAAGNAFCQAAQLHLQLQSKHDAATCFVDAGNAFKKADPQGPVHDRSQAPHLHRRDLRDGAGGHREGEWPLGRPLAGGPQQPGAGARVHVGKPLVSEERGMGHWQSLAECGSRAPARPVADQGCIASPCLPRPSPTTSSLRTTTKGRSPTGTGQRASLPPALPGPPGTPLPRTDLRLCPHPHSSANKCLLKVAGYAAQLEQYQKAIDIYEQVGRHPCLPLSPPWHSSCPHCKTSLHPPLQGVSLPCASHTESLLGGPGKGRITEAWGGWR
uniref:NSF attachment protein alpha n=1 Tax=Suricata suricatta TaxID=37032 RepID=A0A673UNY6_SURSU